MIVAAAKSRGDGVDAVTPVQRVGVVESEWPGRRFIFCKEVMRERKTLNPTAVNTQQLDKVQHISHSLNNRLVPTFGFDACKTAKVSCTTC